MGPEQETHPQLQIPWDMKAILSYRMAVRMVCLSCDPLIKSSIFLLVLCATLLPKNISITIALLENQPEQLLYPATELELSAIGLHQQLNMSIVKNDLWSQTWIQDRKRSSEISCSKWSIQQRWYPNRTETGSGVEELTRMSVSGICLFHTMLFSIFL